MTFLSFWEEFLVDLSMYLLAPQYTIHMPPSTRPTVHTFQIPGADEEVLFLFLYRNESEISHEKENIIEFFPRSFSDFKSFLLQAKCHKNDN